MKLIALKEHLLKTLSSVSLVIGIKTDLPILSNIYLKAEGGQLTAVGTNLDSTIEIKTPVKVENPGETTVPAKTLIDFLQGSKEEKVTLELVKDTLVASTSYSVAKIPTISSEEFPKPKPFAKEEKGVLSKKDFLEAASQVAFCAAPEIGRPVLTGVLLNPDGEKCQFVATDGYRLARKELKIKVPAKILIPARAFREAAKIASDQDDDFVEIGTDTEAHQVKIQIKNASLITRLLSGDYPNYEQIIPSSFPTKIELNKEELVDATRLASLFSKDIGNVVRLESSKDKLRVKANTAQVGEAEVTLESKKTGEDIQIAFNSKYLSEPLSAMKSNVVKLSFSGRATAALVEGSEDKNLMYIVMPVRTQS